MEQSRGQLPRFATIVLGDTVSVTDLDLFGDQPSGVRVIEAQAPPWGYAISEEEMQARQKPAAPKGRRERGLEAIWLTMHRDRKREFDDLVFKLRHHFKTKLGWEYTPGEIALKAVQAYAAEILGANDA